MPVRARPAALRRSRARRPRSATLRQVDNVTNLVYLLLEYLGIAATIAGAVGFAE